MATIKLYDESAYNTEFSAEIVSAGEVDKEERLPVIFDKTLFFPEEGGQTCDRGTVSINGREFTVDHVSIDKANTITHFIHIENESDIALFKSGTKVSGKINFNHRFSNMQQHTGEHIFSGLVCGEKGYNNVGFHLSDDIVTMDYSGPLTDDEIAYFEKKANEVIYRNIEVKCEYPSAEELKNINYRSKIEIEGSVRIVTIPGVDVCACCAPHVRRTGEIGMLKVMDHINYKGGTRLSILCGYRALAAFNSYAASLKSISNTLSESKENLAESVTKLKKEKGDADYKLRKKSGEILALKAANIPADAENVTLFTDECDVNEVRKLINELTEKHKGFVSVYTGTDESGYSYIIGSRNLDCTEMAKVLKEKYGAKGGGKREMIQGHVAAPMKELYSL